MSLFESNHFEYVIGNFLFFLVAQPIDALKGKLWLTDESRTDR